MQVELTPEIVSIAQVRANQLGLKLSDELARIAFEEVLFNLDPELNLLVNQTESLNAIDCLANAIKVNDVVVNNARFDVRAIDEDGRVHVPKILVGSLATENGTFAVKLESDHKATVVGYLSAGNLISSTEYDENDKQVIVDVDTSKDVDIEGIMKEAQGRIQLPLDKLVKEKPGAQEVLDFLASPHKIPYARQRDLIAVAALHKDVNGYLRRLPAQADGYTPGVVSQMLRAGSTWNKRTEELSINLAPKFKSLSQKEIKNTLTDLGESYGGQPEAPRFKKAALRKLTQEHVARSLGAEKLAKAKAVIDQVFEGKSLVDAVKDRVKNSVAVDLAMAIKKNRKNVQGFVAASAEEIGMAFQQLAIQPAYATHSSADGGVDSINEALELLETCEMLEELEV